MPHFHLVDPGSSQLLFLEPHVLPVLHPPHLLLGLPLAGKDVGLHPPAEQAFVLLEVANVNLVFQQFPPPRYLEIEPLQVPSRV